MRVDNICAGVRFLLFYCLLLLWRRARALLRFLVLYYYFILTVKKILKKSVCVSADDNNIRVYTSHQRRVETVKRFLFNFPPPSARACNGCRSCCKPTMHVLCSVSQTCSLIMPRYRCFFLNRREFFSTFQPKTITFDTINLPNSTIIPRGITMWPHCEKIEVYDDN